MDSLTFNNLSPEEKVAKYKDFNNLDDSDLGFLNYKANTPAKVDIPNIDYSSNLLDNALIAPLYQPVSKPIDPPKIDPVITPTITPKVNVVKQETSVNPNQAALSAYKYLVNNKNISKEAAAGIVGNLFQESGVDPTRQQNNGGPGRGIAQWGVGDRWKAFQDWSQKRSRDILDLPTQLDYILQEPGQESAIRRTLTSKTPEEAALNFGKYFEGPSSDPKVARYDIRIGIANSLYNSKI